jgi:putative spermidine/putrescine transport system substrate-binding protein/spermidine/putrescine transport system substrate-binding protein
VVLGLLAAVAVLATGCGGDDGGAAADASATASNEPCTPKGTLNAILWEGYAPEASIAGFEKKYPGVKVKVTSIGSNDEVFAKIRTKSGQYDLIPATTDVSKQYVDQGLIQPIDLQNVPNAERLFPAFRDLEQATKDGKTYGVAHTWSADPILYNADVVKDPPASYEVLFDPKYKGKVSIYDDLGSLWVGAQVRDLPPFALDDTQLGDVTDLMREQKDLVRKYWSTGDDLVKLMASGEVVLATGWNYMYTQLRDEGVNVERLIPEEGNLGWVDTLMVPVEAKNKCAAEKWMDWALSAEGGVETARASGYSIANPDVAKGLKPEEVKDLHMDDPEFVDQIVLWQAVDRPKYQDAWNKVKNG